MSTTVILEGKEDGVPCGKDVRVKIWKQGHSIKCEKTPHHSRTEIRYWPPSPDIFSEVKDFCKGCELNPEREIPSE